MPHVSQFVHKMGKGRKGAKEKRKQSRNRSDLTIDEFGATTRYKDDSLSGQAMSLHWNEKGEVFIAPDDL